MAFQLTGNPYILMVDFKAIGQYQLYSTSFYLSVSGMGHEV